MNGSIKEVVVTRKQIRLEVKSDHPDGRVRIEHKEFQIALAHLDSAFRRYKGRSPGYDDDYWLEPMDEGIAFVFEVETREDAS